MRACSSLHPGADSPHKTMSVLQPVVEEIDRIVPSRIPCEQWRAMTPQQYQQLWQAFRTIRTMNQVIQKAIAEPVSFPCPDCSRTFKKSGDLTKHRIGMHGLTWTKETLAAELRHLHGEGIDLSSRSFQRQYPTQHHVARRLFGTYRLAVECAGLDYASISRCPLPNVAQPRPAQYMTNPKAPQIQAQTVDAEVRGRIEQARKTGKRPMCGYM